MKYLDAQRAKALGGDAATHGPSAGAKQDRRGIEDKMLRGPVADKTAATQAKKGKGKKKQDTTLDATLDVQDQLVTLAPTEPDDENAGEEVDE